MVEELKLAVKVDDDVIEQSLLKQFNNAEKLADKVVFTFKNVNLDNKEIEKQFKDMQKLAGKNPIELPIDTDKSLKMLQALGDEFTRIISIAKGLDKNVGNGIGNSIVDEKSLNSIIDLFGKMENHLGEMKKVFADVGDGEEFSPLLKMINDVQASIKELSTSVSKIKLDVNMDLGSGVNEERLNQKVSQSMNRQLEAYRNLFAAMKSTGKTNKEMLRFFEPDDASISEIIGAYKSMIKRAEEQFGKDIYKNKIGKDIYSTYVKEIKNATDQFNRATNKKNTENPLGDLFGKNELIEVVSQLGLIADRLSEISSTVSGLGDTFKSVFKEGFNISATVEEIEKLTSRVKELEDELSKVKLSPTASMKDTFQGDVKASESATSLGKEADEMKEIAEVTPKATKAKNEFADANERVDKGAKKSSESISEEASEFNKIISKLDGYNTKLEKFQVKPNEGNRFPVYQESINDLSNKIERLQALSKKEIDLINENDVKDARELQKEIDGLILKMSKMSAGEKGFDPLSLDKAIQKMTGELEKASGMSKKAKADIQALIKELSTGNPTRTTKEILHDFYKIIQAEQEAGRYGKAFMDIFKDKVIYGAAGQLAGMFGFYDVINGLREGITVVRELDTALTEMRKVSDETVSSLENLQDVSFDLGNSVGTTAIQIQNSIADFMRIGDSAEEAKKHAIDANTLLQVSEFDNIEDATSALVSMNQAWKDIDTQHINDVLNILGNNMPIATDELASSLQRSAGTLATLGATLEEAAALTVAGKAICLKIWKHILKNIFNCKVNLKLYATI